MTWDENKRRSNIKKHGLDFAYVFGKLAALLVVYAERVESIRIISFRYASEKESEAYYEWLENEFEKTTDDT
ncbi:MAG: BrnT family toxin [Alistipes senegalensis]|nr:BrnT family toxin [Oxalobacter formigenes]MCM1280481.1 BrnT family toxin [Alistipes senegalensis]